VDALEVAGRLGLGEVVIAGQKVEEDVGAVAVGRLGQVDRVAEEIRAGQGDGHAADALLAEIDLAVVVEVFPHYAGQAGRREGSAVDRERVADRGNGIGRGVVDQRAGAVDVDGVAARVGGRAEV